MKTNGQAHTCGQCLHWHELPLSNGQQGECREGPPQIAVPLVNKLTGQMHGMIVAYPGMQDSFPACARFQARVALGVE